MAFLRTVGQLRNTGPSTRLAASMRNKVFAITRLASPTSPLRLHSLHTRPNDAPLGPQRKNQPLHVRFQSTTPPNDGRNLKYRFALRLLFYRIVPALFLLVSIEMAIAYYVDRAIANKLAPWADEIRQEARRLGKETERRERAVRKSEGREDGGGER